jgi:hypothetical protein
MQYFGIQQEKEGILVRVVRLYCLEHARITIILRQRWLIGIQAKIIDNISLQPASIVAPKTQILRH